MKHLTTLALAAAAIFATAAQAAPYAVTLTGTIDGSTFAEIRNGERYAATFVYDSGSTTAGDQTWTRDHLRCVIWRMNNDASVVYTQTSFNGVAQPIPVDTDSGGVLYSRPYIHTSNASTPDSYTVRGFALTRSANWVADNYGQATFRDGATSRQFNELITGTRGGSTWGRSAVPVASACDAPVLPPGIPTQPRATPGNGEVTLHWTPPVGGAASRAPSMYYVNVLVGNTIYGSCGVDHPATSCTVSGLTNGTAYQFNIIAIDANGDYSPPATVLHATPSDDPAPAAPTHITATPGNGQVTVGWRAWQASDGGTAPAYYHVVQIGQGRVCQVPHGNAPQCVVTGLTNGEPYGFHVMAVSATDSASPPSANAWAIPGGAVPNPNPGGVQPVPTLGAWGLTLLAGLLGLAGLNTRRKNA